MTTVTFIINGKCIAAYIHWSPIYVQLTIGLDFHSQNWLNSLWHEGVRKILHHTGMEVVVAAHGWHLNNAQKVLILIV